MRLDILTSSIEVPMLEKSRQSEQAAIEDFIKRFGVKRAPVVAVAETTASIPNETKDVLTRRGQERRHVQMVRPLSKAARKLHRFIVERYKLTGERVRYTEMRRDCVSNSTSLTSAICVLQRRRLIHYDRSIGAIPRLDEEAIETNSCDQAQKSTAEGNSGEFCLTVSCIKNGAGCWN